MTLKSPRMTKTIVLTIAAAFVVLWGIVYSNVLGANVTATWTYDYRPEPACSDAQITNCIDHFEVQDITDQQNRKLIRRVDNPEHPAGKVDGISVTFKYGPPFGQRTISVIAVGRDLRGNRIASNPFAARANVTIRPGAKMAVLF
jgi:hypothetical protein